MLKAHYIYYHARPLATRDDQRSWPVGLGVALIALLCLVSLLARIPLVPANVPFSADIHVGTLFVLILALYHLPFDVAATLGVVAFVLLARLLLGPTYGQVYLSPALGVAIPLLLLAVLSDPMMVMAYIFYTPVG